MEENINGKVNRKIVSLVMSEMARKGHKKSPRGKKFYQDMSKARWAKIKKDAK